MRSLNKGDEKVLKAIFGTGRDDSRQDEDAVLADPEVDAVLGVPPHRIARKKTRRALWYRISVAHSRTLQARHRDHVESYVVAVERIDEVERVLGRFSLDARYSDETRAQRMWLRNAQINVIRH